MVETIVFERVGDFKKYVEENEIELDEEQWGEIENAFKQGERILIIPREYYAYGYVDSPNEELNGLHAMFVEHEGRHYVIPTHGISYVEMLSAIYIDDNINICTESQFYKDAIELPDPQDTVKELKEVYGNIFVITWSTTNEVAVHGIVTNVPDGYDGDDVRATLDDAGYFFGEFGIPWANHGIHRLEECSEEIINRVARILDGTEEIGGFLGKLKVEPIIIDLDDFVY